MFLVLLGALASQDVRIAECRVACRYLGFDGGSTLGQYYCYCYDVFDREKITGYKKTVLPNRVKTTPGVSSAKWLF